MLSSIPLIISTLNDRHFPSAGEAPVAYLTGTQAVMRQGFPVILSHTLGATSSITERQRRICYRSFTPLRSVQDDRVAVPFSMTMWSFRSA